MTAQETDRAAIAENLLDSLAELDQLKAAFQEKQSAVEAAQQEEAEAAGRYSAKIAMVLESGWATVPALTAQGHRPPRRKRGDRRRQGADEQAAATTHTDLEN